MNSSGKLHELVKTKKAASTFSFNAAFYYFYDLISITSPPLESPASI
jgi:hypothetical protein